jgi:membrane peptidoglycan carboxypeptidase
MMRKNGHKRKATERARKRVLKVARMHGYITNEQAQKAMKLDQVWYHLNILQKAGFLKRTNYNTWEMVRRRGRPRLTV